MSSVTTVKIGMIAKNYKIGRALDSRCISFYCPLSIKWLSFAIWSSIRYQFHSKLPIRAALEYERLDRHLMLDFHSIGDAAALTRNCLS
jgi:hypothetical protein